VGGIGDLESDLEIALVRARAALVAIFDIAVLVLFLTEGHCCRLFLRLVALHKAFWLLAIRGPVADPLARRASALGLALGLRGHADGLTLRWQANIFATRATTAGAVLLDAANLALRLLAANHAVCDGELLAHVLALWLHALRKTLCRACWLIAQPVAVGEALVSMGRSVGHRQAHNESEH